MAKAKEITSEETMLGVEIPPIALKHATLRIIGDTPLIVHAWSVKAKTMLLGKQMRKATQGREAKDPWEDFCDSLYWLTPRPENPTMEDVEKAKFGFPVLAFKACAIDAGYQQGLLAKKTTARGAFRILGEFAEIEGTPEPREDMVRIGMGTADIRYRGEFKTWATTLDIDYNPRSISIEQIVNLMNMGGFSNGIGEWRPSKDGSFGTFHVAATGEV